MAHWVGIACFLDGNWMAIGTDCIHGSSSLRTAVGMGAVIPAMQLGSMSLTLACWGYFSLLCCAECFAVSQH